MSNELTPGDYRAKPVDWGLSKTNTGKNQVYVDFALENGKYKKWYSMLDKSNPKGLDITLKALLAMGFYGTDVSILAEGRQGAALDKNKEVKLVLENEEYNGKTSLKVRWVNPIYDVKNKLDRAGAVQAFEGLDFGGDLLRLQEETGIENAKRPSEEHNSQGTGQTTDANFTADDIPF